MNNLIMIPDWEYKERVKAASIKIQKKGLDLFIASGSESDYANVRYFSGFWPLFERAGVAIAPNGEAALICGPESKIFAADRSKLDKLFVLLEYRESANPSYPELKCNNFGDVAKALKVSGIKRIGIGGYIDTNVVIMDGIREAFPNAEIVNADDIMLSLRSIKSENELACMREGFRITDVAMHEVMRAIKPGMTELALVGIAQKVIYEEGAEYEGLPMYVFSEKSTSHAISRPSYRRIGKGDIVQLNLSAKVDGYSPSIGWPISMGPLAGSKREHTEFCLAAHKWTYKQLKAGVKASTIAKDFYNFYLKNGYVENFLYGPCHGTGMIEVEAPWMETTSGYILEPNMTFQVDTFISTKDYGIRWETGIVVTNDGCQLLSNPIGEIYEVDC